MVDSRWHEFREDGEREQRTLRVYAERRRGCERVIGAARCFAPLCSQTIAGCYPEKLEKRSAKRRVTIRRSVLGCGRRLLRMHWVSSWKGCDAQADPALIIALIAFQRHPEVERSR